jgi:hypothetical protein
MAKFPNIQNRLALAATVFAAAWVLSAAPAAADAASELFLFNFGTAADHPKIEYAQETPDGPMPLLPVEFGKDDDQGQEPDQASETGAGGS